MTILIQFLSDEDGATTIEYGLIAALISIVTIGAMTSVGTNLKATFNTINTALAR